MSQLSEERFASAVSFWRERMRALAPGSAYLHLIVNEGVEAGASREHSHAQLYALRFVPVDVARERERMKAYNERTMGGDLLEDVVTEEVRRRDRVVAVDDDAILVCPWASRSPFEMRVIPRRRAARFEEDEGVGTAMIRRAIEGLATLFGPPPFNLWVRTAPRDAELFRWHVDIVPRLTVLAGFELGTGTPINVYPPERAASDLREALG
jgi:UDPglucose--hexose-1-phosphate uridylyltransferase